MNRHFARASLAGALALAAAAAGCVAETDGITVDQATFALEAETACGEYATPILAGQTINSGSVVVTNNAENLLLQFDSNTLEGWQIRHIHVYAGLDPIPVNNAGTPAPGQFPYSIAFDPTVTSYFMAIPLAELGVEGTCGAVLNMAIHLEMVRVVDGVVVQEETGWAFGENEFESNRWGWWFTYTICCDEPETETGCTRTLGYWKTHNEFASRRSLRINWPLPEDESALLCSSDSRTMLALLNATPASGDAYVILAHQYIAARLNVASGASTTAEVDGVMDEAASLLAANCGTTVQASTETGQLMVILAGVLDAYNNGLVGPGHCQN